MRILRILQESLRNIYSAGSQKFKLAREEDIVTTTQLTYLRVSVIPKGGEMRGNQRTQQRETGIDLRMVGRDIS